MGDIYHAGEVYAGSVPIDDTQASEDTVYSSAKVETMVDEKIEDHIKKWYSKTITPTGGSDGTYSVAENVTGYDFIGISANDTGYGAISCLIPCIPDYQCSFLLNITANAYVRIKINSTGSAFSVTLSRPSNMTLSTTMRYYK